MKIQVNLTMQPGKYALSLEKSNRFKNAAAKRKNSHVSTFSSETFEIFKLFKCILNKREMCFEILYTSKIFLEEERKADVKSDT